MTNLPENEFPVEISVESVKQMMNDAQAFLLLDCREPQENEFCRIESATLIPMNETPQRLEELEPHRGSRIVVHCHHGGRSLQVTQYLRSQGFELVQNMTGGIDAWSIAIDPDMPRY